MSSMVQNDLSSLDRSWSSSTSCHLLFNMTWLPWVIRFCEWLRSRSRAAQMSDSSAEWSCSSRRSCHVWLKTTWLPSIVPFRKWLSWGRAPETSDSSPDWWLKNLNSCREATRKQQGIWFKDDRKLNAVENKEHARDKNRTTILGTYPTKTKSLVYGQTQGKLSSNVLSVRNSGKKPDLC